MEDGFGMFCMRLHHASSIWIVAIMRDLHSNFAMGFCNDNLENDLNFGSFPRWSLQKPCAICSTK